MSTRSIDIIIFWQQSGEPRKREKTGVKEKERARNGMPGWTNSIVVGRLTAIGQRDIQLLGFNASLAS